jgi:phosphate starvation-inducible PhoH-like protein
MSKSASRFTRKSKIDKEVPPVHKDKFQEETASQPVVPKFEAKTQNQKLALAYLREGKTVVSLQGSAGVGKSILAAFWASTQLKQKKVEEIILIRPNILNGKTIGLLSGDEKQKLEPFMAQTMAHFKKFLGTAYLTYCVNKGIIQTRAFEYVRGRSFENCIVIVEEAQGLTPEEYETLLTRVGEGTQLILTGDSRQINKGFNTGMDVTFKMIEDAVQNEYDFLDDEDLDCLNDSVGVVHFTPDDILRSGFCRAIVKLYYYK